MITNRYRGEIIQSYGLTTVFCNRINELVKGSDRLLSSPPRLTPGNFVERIALTLHKGELEVYVTDQEREVIVVTDLPGVEKENVEISLDYPRTDRDIVRENGMQTVERSRDRYRVVKTSGAICRGITHPHGIAE